MGLKGVPPPEDGSEGPVRGVGRVISEQGSWSSLAASWGRIQWASIPGPGSFCRPRALPKTGKINKSVNRQVGVVNRFWRFGARPRRCQVGPLTRVASRDPPLPGRPSLPRAGVSLPFVCGHPLACLEPDCKDGAPNHRAWLAPWTRGCPRSLRLLLHGCRVTELWFLPSRGCFPPLHPV